MPRRLRLPLGILVGAFFAVVTSARADFNTTAVHDFVSLPAAPAAGLFAGSDGALYGTAAGGPHGLGVVFKVQPDGSDFTVLHAFDGADGMYPESVELVGAGGVLYGVATLPGGPYNHARLFRLNEDGSGFASVQDFDGVTGRPGLAGLVLSGGVLYGVAQNWISGDELFKVNVDGTGLAGLHIFPISDRDMARSLMMSSDGALYGVAERGGLFDGGMVFKINPDGSAFANLHDFGGGDAAGWSPSGRLAEVAGVLYGTTQRGGADAAGTVFRIGMDGTDFATVVSLGNASGVFPTAGLVSIGNVLYGAALGGVNHRGVVFRVDTDGSGLAPIVDFGGANGAGPMGGLLNVGGVLYATTQGGGAMNQGTLFRVNADGTGFTTIRSMGQADPQGFWAGLLNAGGVLYGASHSGGAHGRGTVFRMNEDGTGFEVLYDFAGTGPTPGGPSGTLVAGDGVLYGTTLSHNPLGNGAGSVFRLGMSGTGFATLHTFRGTDGYFPMGLLRMGDWLYGTTVMGGAYGGGVVYRIRTDGTAFKVLLNFSGANGQYANGPLATVGGVLYGTTSYGTGGSGTVFRLNADGTGYKKLHQFVGSEATPSHRPLVGVVSDGARLFGTTSLGGSHGKGVVFSLKLDGTDYRELAQLDGPTGFQPVGRLLLAGGMLYGTGSTYDGLESRAFRLNRDGTRFETLASFDVASGTATQGLVKGAFNSFLGTTSLGGQAGGGNIFRVTAPVSVSVSDARRKEGNTGTADMSFAITLSAPSAEPVAVDFTTADGTATAGVDYTTVSSTLFFSPGEVSRTVQVPIIGDTFVEAHERFFLNATSATGANVTGAHGVGTILDDDLPALAIANAGAFEGTSGFAPLTFAVTLSPASPRTVTVQFATAPGTASAGSDYLARSGTLTFAPGETVKTIAVPVRGDTVVEATETFFVDLRAPVAATLQDPRGGGRIRNDD